ncbi:MAG: hypothetical protein ACJAZR_002231, partial [Sediminicola sp.]
YFFNAWAPKAPKITANIPYKAPINGTSNIIIFFFQR